MERTSQAGGGTGARAEGLLGPAPRPEGGSLHGVAGGAAGGAAGGPEAPSREAAAREGKTPWASAWLRFHERKHEVHRLHRSVWSMPVHRKRGPLLRGLVAPGARVLDFGAGGRSWEEKVLAAAPRVEYRSLDQDRATRQDYHSLEEVEGLFDLILLIEVIEHLSFEDGVELLARLRGLLSPGGRLLLTTPNTAHPTQYWQDPTHRTAWAWDFLGAALLHLGYRDLRFQRTHHAKLPTFLLHRFLGWLTLRWLDLDFAGTLAVSAERGER